MTDDEFAALSEEAGLVAAMSDHPGWDALLRRMNHQMFIKQKELIHGRASNFEDYKAKVAWMEGASYVLDLPKVIAEALSSEIESRVERERAA